MRRRIRSRFLFLWLRLSPGMIGIFRGFRLLLVRLFWFRLEDSTVVEYGHFEDLWIAYGLWKRYGLFGFVG